jgi:hypothetical protein
MDPETVAQYRRNNGGTSGERGLEMAAIIKLVLQIYFLNIFNSNRASNGRLGLICP